VPDAKDIIRPKPGEEDIKETGLCLAAAYNNADAIEMLLARGADIEQRGNAITADKHMEFDAARRDFKIKVFAVKLCRCLRAHRKLTSLPISKRTSQVYDEEGVMTPLEMALCHNSNEALLLLLERGAKEVKRAFGIAVIAGNYTQVRMIMRYMTDVNNFVRLEEETQETVLPCVHYAVKSGYGRIVELLIKGGARLLIRSEEFGDFNAFEIAIAKDDAEILQVCFVCRV